MDEKAASIDECVSWLQHQVLDLLSLRGVVTKLATNWEQLKLSLRKEGLLKSTMDDWQGPPPPSIPTESAEAVPTAVASIGPVRPTDTGGHDETSQSTVEVNTELSTETFIGPVIPGDAARLTSEHGEIVDQSQTAVQDERTEAVVEKNGNGSMETSESATVQSSGLQMN